MPVDIEKLKSSIGILDVVGKFVEVRQTGGHYRAACPFHGEDQDPSLFVYPDQKKFHCYGCKEEGDIIDFVRKMHGCSLPEAAAYLSETFGVSAENHSPEQRAALAEKKKLLAALEKAQAVFVQRLRGGDNPALNYLRDRGITDDGIGMYGIGYCDKSAPDMQRIGKELSLTNKQLLSLGLLGYDTAGKRFTGRMDGRITFPVYSRAGQIIAFGARAIGGDAEAKYINSPGSVVYSKREAIFGLQAARETIVRTRRVIVVEGYLDAVALAQSGIKGVTACAGTALTTEQLQGLAPLADTFILLFDGDNAGRAALLAGIDKALALGLRSMAVELPDGHDPDSYVRSFGAEALSRLIDADAVDGLIYSLDKRMSTSGLRDITNWMGRLLAGAAASGPVFQALLARRIGDQCGLSPASVLAQFNQTAFKEGGA
jgi:DNA primase